MNLFDSFNYAMTTTATGGFSTHNSSTEFFHSPALEYICAFFCFLSGVNFTLLYAAVIKFKIKDLFKNSEFKFYSRWFRLSPPQVSSMMMPPSGLMSPGLSWLHVCSSERARAVQAVD